METTIDSVTYESKISHRAPHGYSCDSCVFEESENYCDTVTYKHNDCKDEKNVPIFWVKKEESMKKTPHPHAELMLQYAQDMAEDSSIVWQHLARNDIWVDINEGIHPTWGMTTKYRRKPKEPTFVTKKMGIWMDGGYFHASISDATTKNVEAVFNEETGDLVSIKMI